MEFFNFLKPKEVKRGLLGFNIPDDILDMIYIKNVNFKNNARIIFVLGPQSEQGMIDLELPIEEHSEDFRNLKIYNIEYAKLTPKERYTYLKWLESPYENKDISISFVFLFLTVLERRIFETSKNKKAFEILMKIYNNYSFNNSFTFYAFSSIFIYEIISNNFENTKKIIIENEYVGNTPLGLFAKFFLKIPLTSENIINMASDVKFKNKNYIKNHYEKFNKELKNVILKRYKKEIMSFNELYFFFNKNNEIVLLENVLIESKYNQKIYLTNFFLKRELENSGAEMKFYNFYEDEIFKENVFKILEITHNNLKEILKQERKIRAK